MRGVVCPRVPLPCSSWWPRVDSRLVSPITPVAYRCSLFRTAARLRASCERGDFRALFAATFSGPLTRSVPRAIYMLRTIHTSVDYGTSFLKLLYDDGSYRLSNRIFCRLPRLKLFSR